MRATTGYPFSLDTPKTRKLVELTKKFLRIACSHDNAFTFTIKDVCMDLKIESRRLYDLINVLEAIDIITKSAGSQYQFVGLNHIDRALLGFEEMALREQIRAPDSNSRFKLQDLSVWFMKQLIHAFPNSVSLVSIETALSLKSSHVRRLYDITNILEGMKLITITNQRGSKPSYTWTRILLSDVCRSIISGGSTLTSPMAPSDRSYFESPFCPSIVGTGRLVRTPSALDKISLVQLSTPSQALVIDNDLYLGISRNTPGTRTFINSLMYLKMSKSSAFPPASGTPSATPVSAEYFRGNLYATPNLLNLASSTADSSMGATFNPLPPLVQGPRPEYADDAGLDVNALYYN